jgi:hypothetical protein
MASLEMRLTKEFVDLMGYYLIDMSGLSSGAKEVGFEPEDTL